MPFSPVTVSIISSASLWTIRLHSCGAARYFFAKRSVPSLASYKYASTEKPLSFSWITALQRSSTPRDRHWSNLMLLLSTLSAARSALIRERDATTKKPDRSRSWARSSLTSGLGCPSAAKGGTAIVIFLYDWPYTSR